MRIVGRILVWALVLVLVLALALSVWWWWMVRRSFPQTQGTIDVPGLSAPVTIQRDGHGIPNIYADTTEDLFFAQGYVHAQDRFWQMDFNRHITAGRLSELVGESQLDTDKYLRTMGWRRVAEQEWAQASAESKKVLQAYADGVNAYISGRSPTQLGLEYLMLRLTGGAGPIGPWSPVDSLAWGKAIAWDLRGNADDEVNRVRYAAAVGGLRAKQLYPDYPYDEHPVIVPSGTVVNGQFRSEVTAADRPAIEGSGCTGAACPPAGEQLRIETAEEALLGLGVGSAARGGMSPLARATADALEAVNPALDGLAAVEAKVAALIGPVGDGIGSNSWAVAGSQSATGGALLANDPHLGPALPSVWYQVGLHCRTLSDACGYDFAGMSFPGVPAVMAGHNRDAGWAVTNLGPDVTDLVLEKIDDTGYVVDGQHRPFTTREEVIKVAGGDDVTITVRATEHGPLMSDVGETEQEIASTAPVPEDAPDPGAGFGVAYRWTALEPGRTVESIIQLARMKDWDDFRAAAANWAVPAQNLAYADVQGNIGYQTPGQIPIRTGYSGKYPVPGWDSAYGWDGFIDFDALPSIYNPPTGTIVTANNAAIGPQYPYLLTDDWDYGYRAARISTLLQAATAGARKADVATLAAIQRDSYSTIAATLVPQLQQSVSDLDEQTARAFALFDGWDFQASPGSAAAAYFNAFWRNLQDPLYNDELGADARSDGSDRWWYVTSLLWDDPEDAWWDDTATTEREDRDDIVKTALTAAATELTDSLGADPTDWSWGQLHTLTVVANPFGASGIAPLEWVFNRGPVSVGGGSAIVNATGWDTSLTCTGSDDDPVGCGGDTEPAYLVDWVPSYRSVTDFANYDQSVWVHLTGASGHTFNPHYIDQLDLWATGQTFPWAFTQSAVEAAAEDTLTLQPAA